MLMNVILVNNISSKCLGAIAHKALFLLSVYLVLILIEKDYMLEIVVYCAITTIGMLFVLMGFRVSKLYLTSPLFKSGQKDIGGLACLKAAQHFAEQQLSEMRLHFEDDFIESLKETISFYLIGAVEVIGMHNNCSAKSSRVMVIKVLSTNLNLTSLSVSKYYAGAINAKQTNPKDSVVQVGSKAAKAWLGQDVIPEDFTLKFQLLSCA